MSENVYPKASEGGETAHVAPNPSFPDMEETVLDYWDKDDTFQKSVERNPSGDHSQNEFVFFDGPPFANGLPHYGTLDRRLLADRAFATPEGKAVLDALTHPEIVRRIRAAKQAAQQAGAKLFVLDGAVIIGTAAEAECDKLCVVTAPFEVSVERIAARDGISPEMAARRLNAQTPEAVLTARADYILPNTSTREALAKAANELCDALIGEGCRA